MEELRRIIENLDVTRVTDIIISIIPALICITVHEMCHGIAAYVQGDRTAKEQGRISLNPIRHIDPVGLLMLAVFRFGWAKPVSVDMRKFRNPKRAMAITALAGPVSNIVLASVVLFIRGLLTYGLIGQSWGYKALELIDMTAYLSLCLGIFNMIPIPPLDGSKILFSVLPDRYYMQLMRYERYGMILLVLLMFTGVINGPLGAVSGYMFSVMYTIVRAGITVAGVFI